MVQKLVLAFTLMLIFSGCSPKDVPLGMQLFSKSTPDYEGFLGLTEVRTLSSTKIKLKWNTSSDQKVVAYNIYDVSLKFKPVLVKTVSSEMSETTITELTPQRYYVFRVRAADENEKEDGNTVDLPGIPYGGILPAQVQDASSALISFNDGSNSDEINIFCHTSTDLTYSLMKTITNVSLTQTPLTGLVAGTVYTCRASVNVNGFNDNNTVETTFTPMGSASQIVFSTQPASAPAGVVLPAQPVVMIKDPNGNLVATGPDSKAEIKLTIASNSPTGGTIRGTANMTAVGGVATFSGINFIDAGDKLITATKVDTSSQQNGSPSLSVDSGSFTITAGEASDLTSTIVINPAVPPNTPLTANGSSAYSVMITLKDKYGNPVSGVKPTFKSNFGSDTLTQPILATDKNGLATGTIASTFADTVAPFRTLSISAPLGLTATTLAPFVPGTPVKLGFVTQPPNSPSGAGGIPSFKVSLLDAQGNLITTGAEASASITVNITNNLIGASLLGTSTVTAIGGIATFTGLGIDKSQTGYKLMATSGSLVPAFSNSFNVTSGIPAKIVITGPTAAVVSGACGATPIKFQLKDLGNNLTKAIQNTSITVAGLGTASLYSSGTCSGAPLTNILTFTSGTDTKTVYIKDSKAELLAITATDSSNVLQAGSLSLNIVPNKIKLVAPIGGSGTLNVLAGQCSPALVITPLGDNLTAGPLAVPTIISVTGLLATYAKIYSDPACSAASELDPNNVLLQVGSGSSVSTSIYLSDPKAENLSLSVTDASGSMLTVSSQQAISIMPSKITFSGPTTVVAGACSSSSYTIKLVDALNNAVAPVLDTPLTINGLGASLNGKFYSAGGCSPASGSNTTLTFPAGQTQFNVYFKDGNSENLSISMADAAGAMTPSSVVNIGVSPSNFVVTGPSSPSNSGQCVGPFTVSTTDTSLNPSPAITSIQANLSWSGGDLGLTPDLFLFFSDAKCANAISTVAFAQGDSQKVFYFKGLYPTLLPLSLTVTEASNVLQPGSLSYSVIAGKGWIGSAVEEPAADGTLSSWLLNGNNPIATLTADQPKNIYGLTFDSTKRYLYAVDRDTAHILKYDYTNQKYIGWIGQWQGGPTAQSNEIKPYGSGVDSSIDANAINKCKSVSVSTNEGQTPTWCIGGQSMRNRTQNNYGSMAYPSAVAVDDNDYIYVTNQIQNTITRYKNSTGVTSGWLGIQASGCSAKTSWSNSGQNDVVPFSHTWEEGRCYNSGGQNGAYGGLSSPRSVIHNAGKLYVGMPGGILKYDVSGAYQGWVGRIYSSPSSMTSGWSTGGGRYGLGRMDDWSNSLPGPSWEGFRPDSQSGIMKTPMIAVSGNTLVSFDSFNQNANWNNISPYVGWSILNTFNLATGALVSFGSSGLSKNISILGTNGGIDFETNGQVAVDSSGNYYVANLNSVVAMDSSFTVYNTFGQGQGFDEQQFYNVRSVAVDAQGHILTGGDFVGIKKWDSNGNYLGTIALKNTSPTSWSDDANKLAAGGGFDETSMNRPSSVYLYNGLLYMTQVGAPGIKKIDSKTGKTIGWIGGTATARNSSCSTAAHYTTFWCLGEIYAPSFSTNYKYAANLDDAWSNIGYWYDNYLGGNFSQPNVMVKPTGITGDGAYLYVVDSVAARIMKFKLSDGSFIGFVGRTGNYSGPISTNWTTIQATRATNYEIGNGSYREPSSIVHSGGFLYIVDNWNQRVVKINASTGAWVGWIGKGCSPTAWCSTSVAGASGSAAGEFSFVNNGSSLGGITTDDIYLYISNTNNGRIDMWNIATGAYVKSTSANSGYNGGWVTNPTTLPSATNAPPTSLWTDGTYIFGTAPGNASYSPLIWKMDKATGNMVSVLANTRSYKLGGFIGSSSYGSRDWTGASQTETPGFLGITGDSFFVYVSDEGTNRVSRLPK